MKAQVASWAGSLEPYGFKLETPNFKSKCSSGQCAPDSVPMALFGCKNDQSDEKRFQVRTKGRETQGWHQPSAAGLLSNRNTGEDYKLGLTRALGQRKNQDSTRHDMQNRRAVLSFDLRCCEACRCVDLNWGSNTDASVGPFEHAKHAAIPPSDGTQRKPCSQTGLGEVLQSPARKSTPNPFQGKHIEFDANLSFGRGGSEELIP